jgi:hypothetical protein
MPRPSAKLQATVPPAPAPAWTRPLLLTLTALLLLTWFTGEIADTDIWLHLMTGRHTLEHRALTVPDPFSYTSNLASGSPTEAKTRYFNLTHEWLAQITMYLIHSSTGFAGLVLSRALLLVVFCGLVGLMVWWRSHGFLRAIAATVAAGAVAINFQQSRPFLVTFVLLAVTMAILERRQWMWVLPPVFLLWANMHGGYFMGWLMLGAYCGEAVIQRLRKQPVPGERELWLVTSACFVASVINPNGLRAVEIVFNYRSSAIQSSNLEWQYPAFWEPSAYSFVLFGALIVLLIARRNTRPVDWLLFLGFAFISLTAVRNTLFIGLAGTVLLFAYLPVPKRQIPAWTAYLAAVALVVAAAFHLRTGQAFQFHEAAWQLPTRAADFLAEHKVTGRIFNTYENGGYLVWRLWPMQKDFIDPRGLSEEAFSDYQIMLANGESSDGRTAAKLLDKYGIQVLVLDGFDRFSGQVRLLTASLSDPSQTAWKLVQADERSVVFMRRPPPGVQPLNNLMALTSIEQQCNQQLEHDPGHPGCARGLSDIYSRIGDQAKAAQWAAR